MPGHPAGHFFAASAAILRSTAQIRVIDPVCFAHVHPALDVFSCQQHPIMAIFAIIGVARCVYITYKPAYFPLKRGKFNGSLALSSGLIGDIPERCSPYAGQKCINVAPLNYAKGFAPWNDQKPSSLWKLTNPARVKDARQHFGCWMTTKARPWMRWTE